MIIIFVCGIYALQLKKSVILHRFNRTINCITLKFN